MTTSLPCTTTSNSSSTECLDDVLTNVTEYLNDTDTLPQPHLPEYIFIYVTIINLVILLVGVVGNILVILVVFKVKDMRTPMNFYLVSLSVADLLVLLICQPSALAEFYAKRRWYLSEAACKLVPYLEHLVLHASTLIILVITWERYFAICKPLHNNAVCEKTRPLYLIFIMWTSSIITSLPFIFMTHLKYTPFVDGTTGYICTTVIEETWHYVYIGFSFVVFFLLPMTVLTIMYGGIILQLYSDTLKLMGNHHTTAFYRLRSRKQVVRMLISIIVFFFVSLMPLRVFILWQIFTPTTSLEDLGIESFYNIMWFARIMMYLNSAGNPVIYSMLSSKFKMAFKRVLRIYNPDDSFNRRTSLSVRYTFFRTTIANGNELKLSDLKLNNIQSATNDQIPNGLLLIKD
ncbi:hypothetical protein SNE40_017647 [Patella caerulea]|uniref:G-protein coupled receptors family 1 profile domain-containing protein n=1 Tax=Patella caerulea TaxID=87958 RepID=A0AAN8JBI1_PATCE